MSNRLWSFVSKGASTARGGADAVPALGPDLDTHRLIEACAGARAPALVLSFEDAAVCRTRFVAAGADDFRLRAESEVSPLLRPPTQCSVAFQWAQRNRVFIATLLSVRKVEAPEPATELLLRIPGEVAAGDARMAFRVPVFPQANLGVELRVDGVRVEGARALNLSLIGTLIETPNHDFTLPPGTDVEVTVHFGGRQVVLAAEVRRCYERRLALFFPAVLAEGSLTPPEALQEIVRELELLWLRQRTS